MQGSSPIGGFFVLADDGGHSLVEVAWRLFFRIVNQVLVRLWARRLVGDPREWVPSSQGLGASWDAGIAKSDRSRLGHGQPWLGTT